MSDRSRSVFIVFVLIQTIFKSLNGLDEPQDIQDLDDESLNQYPPGALANFTELSRKYGYNSEQHTIVTDDGYILSVFRIPKGKNCRGRVRDPPVLLMHGFLQSSDSWLDAGPRASLAFLISDACYDLWIGNVRGTYYGRRHLRLDPDRDSAFWDFSTDEMGRLDLPATVDYILNTTSSTQINYVGFSQGGRIFYIMCSETQGNCEKIKVFINLAPATRQLYSKSLTIRLFTISLAAIEPILKNPRELEVLPRGGLIQKVLSFICQNNILASTFCKAVLFTIDSVNPGSLATQTIRVLFDHFPAGVSARTTAVYGQNAVEGKFQKYNFGPTRNLEIYGSIQPPSYNVSRTNIPVVIIYGNNDFVVDPRDIKWLASQLTNVVELYQVTNPLWTHLDNCYSQSTKRWIFPKISEYLQKYSQV